MPSLTLLQRLLALTLLIISICACQTTPQLRDGPPISPPSNLASIPQATPLNEPKSRYGNPSSYEVLGKTYFVSDSSTGYKERGYASWYGTKFNGRRTSSGEIYDMYAMTAAHKTLPLPTYVKVTNLNNGKQVVLKVNDRGPFHDGRIIDLSYSAAYQLDILKTGTGYVEVEAISPDSANHSIAEVSPKDDTGVEGENDKEQYLQVAAFSDRLHADKLAAELTAIQPFPVVIKPANTKNALFYRVQIGPLNNAQDISLLSQQITHLVHDDPLMIVD